MTYYGKLPLTSFQTCEKINNIYYYIALFYVVVEVFIKKIGIRRKEKQSST